MRSLLCLLAALLIPAAPAMAQQGRPLDLPGDIAVVVPDTALTLVLTNVTDQRCPAGVDCFWEGMMRVEIAVTTGTRAKTMIVLCNLCDDATRDATIAGHQISLVGLSPSTADLARLNRDPVLADYTAAITVSP
jgi:hypothetical protein